MTFLDFLILVPEMFLINFVIILLWLGVYGRYKSNHPYLLYMPVNIYSNFILLLTILILLNTPFTAATALSNNYVVEASSTTLKFFTLIVSVIVLISSLHIEKNLSTIFLDIEINVLRLLIIFSLLLLLSIDDFMYLFFALEVYALASYVLIGYRGKISSFSAESALKYFVTGTVFSIVMAYAIALIYWTTGLTNFTSLEIYLSMSSASAYKLINFDLLTVGSLLLLTSLFFKLAAAPFHFWAPEVYDGAPTLITYFLFVVPKIAILAIFIKLEFLFSVLTLGVLITAAILSLLVGALGGLFQTKIKRLLTYSMINNNGFFLLALAILNSYSTVFILFFLLAYIITLIGLFTSIINTRLQWSAVALKNMWSWTSLFFINKVQSVATVLLLFSSAGIPPLVGFISKFLILISLILNMSNSHYLILIALIVAPLSSFYYVRLIKVMGFTRKSNWLFLKPLPSTAAYVLSAAVIAIFLLFITSGLWINLIILSIL